MATQNDIEFLEEFRSKIEQFIVLGFVPVSHGDWPNETTSNWDKIQQKPRMRELRREINQMKSRAMRILHNCGVGYMLIQYPAPAIGGPILRFGLFDLVTDNASSQSMKLSDFTDKIDEAIGNLKTHNSEEVEAVASKPVTEISKGFVFIVMPMIGDDDLLVDVHETIKLVAGEMGLSAQRVDDNATNERITDRILDEIARAEYVVADLTHGRPNVYYEAGYAHALGKVPIYIAREGTNIEFDLKDYPVLFFKNMKTLRDSLNIRFTRLLTLAKPG